MKYNSLFVVLLFIFQLSTAQVDKRTYYADEGLTPREQSVDFTHLKLELAFEPKNKKVKGKATETFTVLRKEIDSLFIDGIKMTYFNVLLDGKKVDYKKSDYGLTLYFNEKLKWNNEHSIEIEYEAHPKKGIYFIGWDDTTGESRKQIWTQGQGIDNRHWIPMYDERNDKVVSEMIINFPEGYEVLSNGVLLSKEKVSLQMNKPPIRWHYKISEPHSPYLIMLGIGNYGIKETKSAGGIPIKLYYYPDQKEQVEPTYIHSVEMFDLFEKEIGVPFPWKTYSQIPVQDFMYGAMENTTATIYGDFYMVDERGFLDRNYVRVNAHELAHQWFGNMVTARSPAHHWLHESFATHFDMMYQAIFFGKDHYDFLKRDYTLQCLSASRSDVRPLAHSKAGTVRHYFKGALIIQMLKEVVGKEQYNEAVKYYLNKHAYGNVDSKDLLVAFHERLGLSLDWFWEQWIYKGGEPKYEVDFKQKKKKGTFTVRQTHEQNDLVGLFKMPIVFEVHFEDGTKSTKKVWIEKDTSVVEFDLGKKKVDYVLFDPDSRILKEVSFPKSAEMLKVQAEKAKHMIDRYDAYRALDTMSFKGKNKFLMERFDKENFHLNKGELINQLAREEDLYEEILLKGVNAPSTDVKKAALNNTLKVSPEMEEEYVQLLSDSSYVVIERSLELLTLNNPENAEKYLELTKGMKGDRSNNIHVTRLKIIALVQGSEEALNELIDHSSAKHEFLTRSNAMKALTDINYVNTRALDNILEARLHFNSRLRVKAHQALEHFQNQEKYRQLVSDYITSKNWTEKEKKALKRYTVEAD